MGIVDLLVSAVGIDSPEAFKRGLSGNKLATLNP